MSTLQPDEGATTIHVTLPASLDACLCAIGVALGLPEHHVRNLDALLDCLRELEEPTVLVLEGWQELAWQDPQGWARLREVLWHRAQEGGRRTNPAFGPAAAFGIRRG